LLIFIDMNINNIFYGHRMLPNKIKIHHILLLQKKRNRKKCNS